MSRYIITFFAALLLFSTVKAEEITITDASIQPGEQVVWTADNTYILDGFVFVEEGSELWIEAGTVIKGKPGEAANASALVVAKGGKIYAMGTPTQPIIFTAESDDVNDPYDLTKDDRGLWGGVIILGKAGINVAGGEEQIEGIPVEESRGAYGGNENDDNSGIIRFISIRHAGSNIGQDNEINGLTMGGVGSGTVIEFVEVFSNKDDGFEWFGGTVNTRYLVSAFSGDDGFDYDEGFRGKGQFWFSIQDDIIGNSAGEHDGGTTPEDGQPYSMPQIYNATYIGSGVNSTNTKNNPFINMRDNAGGKYFSSIFMDAPGFALQVEDLESGEDSRARLEAGNLEYTNNIWYNFKDGLADPASQQFTLDYLSDPSNNNREIDPMLVSISRTEDGGLDPRPEPGSPAFQGYKEVPNDGFYTKVDYVGAFGPHELWIKNWTFLDEAGFTPQTGANEIVITDDDIQPGQEVVWSSNNTYILDGFVFVEEGSELWIEAGTVIKGKPGEAANASALVVAKGGKIYAMGTPTQPIIFTAESDDVNDPYDLTKDDRGLWGGVIILGKAGINVAGGEEQIEGIPVEESRGAYGGNENDDNSGIIRFISIRHAGSNIGQDNEINGLTMGGVGSGTVIEFVEVFSNKDDGFEWFGGTVNTRYLVSAFSGDDGFDYDEGFRGKGQFWFSIQDDIIGNSAGEHDGGTTPEDGQPYSMPQIYNATYIGSGVNSTNTKNNPFINMRDNAGGKYFSSIFMDAPGFALQVEDLESGEDSRARLEAGNLEYTNNIWYNFKDGLADPATQQFTLDYLTNSSNNNRVIDPMLVSIGRSNDAELDPRPEENSPVYSGYITPEEDGFYLQTEYIGAFDKYNWAVDWTFLGAGNYASPFGARTIVEYPETGTSVIQHRPNFTSENIAEIYPNPTYGASTLQFSLVNDTQVKAEVYNLLGTKVMTLMDEYLITGTYKLDFDASALNSGMYVIKISTNDDNITTRFIKK
ncbi:MAG: T9SS type A sorting domain-containing protein [Candidatus Kapaibacterium sp.]